SSSRRRHTRFSRDWSSDVCSSDLVMQILVIEDDKRISDFLIKGLEENAYMVTLCKSAEDVLNDFLNIQFDLIICDIMLSGIDGIQLVQTLRFKNIFTPVLMLSA